ncbi:hypothetical protein BN2475_550010 [Paraburkholderia ribeironis]|uniref:Uncharacterized protein n=1 Tax=Paraburkholderia ribeironis TaxID=1247936 RepID=A0A1N7SDB0_9BURK|nr:hypothetical protein BN2475_550010 [Paraburkholderia ribeironis]
MLFLDHLFTLARGDSNRFSAPIKAPLLGVNAQNARYARSRVRCSRNSTPMRIVRSASHH